MVRENVVFFLGRSEVSESKAGSDFCNRDVALSCGQTTRYGNGRISRNQYGLCINGCELFLNGLDQRIY